MKTGLWTDQKDGFHNLTVNGRLVGCCRVKKPYPATEAWLRLNKPSPDEFRFLGVCDTLGEAKREVEHNACI